MSENKKENIVSTLGFEVKAESVKEFDNGQIIEYHLFIKTPTADFKRFGTLMHSKTKRYNGYAYCGVYFNYDGGRTASLCFDSTSLDVAVIKTVMAKIFA